MIPNVQKPSAPCFNIQIDFTFLSRSLHLPFLAPLCLPCFLLWFFFVLLCFQGRAASLTEVTASSQLNNLWWWIQPKLLHGRQGTALLSHNHLLPSDGNFIACCRFTAHITSNLSLLYVACAFSNFAAGVGRASLGLWQVMPCCSVVVMPEFYSSIDDTWWYNDTVQHAFLSNNWDWGDKDLSHPCSRSHFARGIRTLPYGILMARLVVLRCFFLIAPFCLAKEGNNSRSAFTGVERLLKQGSRRSRKAEVQQENVLKGDWNEQPFPGQGRRIVSQRLMNQHIL